MVGLSGYLCKHFYVVPSKKQRFYQLAFFWLNLAATSTVRHVKNNTSVGQDMQGVPISFSSPRLQWSKNDIKHIQDCKEHHWIRGWKVQPNCRDQEWSPQIHNSLSKCIAHERWLVCLADTLNNCIHLKRFRLVPSCRSTPRFVNRCTVLLIFEKETSVHFVFKTAIIHDE